MSLLDGLLGQINQNPTVAGLAAKVGMSPDQVEAAITGLVQAHTQPTDTVATASDQTGVPEDKLHEILGHLGGEGALGQLSGLAGAQEGGLGGLGGMLSGLFAKK
ncbi:hypothetical protein [Sphingomonas bacterium]|uniref:hypothetical protein n=1 Tax=Sphingomonas bacterium TaxID=1895847 RepID=UPI0015762D43|nr:hypothetical protein [Sphingomonas bacterium]